MKKFIFIIPVLLMITFVFYACKKENQNDIVSTDQTELPNNEIDVKDGVLTFGNTMTYEEFADSFHERPENAMRIIGNSNFTSLYDLAEFDENGELIYDSTKVEYPEFLLRILNQDTIVHIGSYFIKLDPRKEIVYLLNEVDVEHYTDLVNNIENSAILLASMEDDVIDQLYHSENAKTSNFWCRGGQPGDSDSPRFLSTPDYRFTLTVTYNKFGIYFEAHTRIVTRARQNVTFQAFPTTNDLISDASYTIKCGKSHKKYEQKEGNRVSINNISIYRNVRGLEKYDFKAYGKVYIDGANYLEREARIKKG